MIINIFGKIKKNEIPEFEWKSIATNLSFKNTTKIVPKTPGCFLYKIGKLGMGDGVGGKHTEIMSPDGSKQMTIVNNNGGTTGLDARTLNHIIDLRELGDDTVFAENLYIKTISQNCTIDVIYECENAMKKSGVGGRKNPFIKGYFLCFEHLDHSVERGVKYDF